METILTPNPHRFILFPIEHLDIFTMYKKLVSVRWIVEEVDTSKDMKDFEKLSNKEQHFIKRILGFFAGSDGISMRTLLRIFQMRFSCQRLRLSMRSRWQTRPATLRLIAV
jgi:ribonucleotide reductase beta subunit family protein with ferritin-like domain